MYQRFESHALIKGLNVFIHLLTFHIRCAILVKLCLTDLLITCEFVKQAQGRPYISYALK